MKYNEIGNNYWDWIEEVVAYLGHSLTIEENKEYQTMYLEMAHNI